MNALTDRRVAAAVYTLITMAERAQLSELASWLRGRREAVGAIIVESFSEALADSAESPM